MMDERHLVLGLNALSRAHETNYFADGHRGAAIISALHFCRENDVEPGVSETLSGMIEGSWATTSLCSPFPEEPADAGLLTQIADELAAGAEDLRQAGHNVIFGSLALRAFAGAPTCITPSRVEGICKVIRSFDEADDIRLEDADAFPAFDTHQSMAEFALTELLRTMEGFDGRGQGWSGHMMTFGRAVIDLSELGWHDVAQRTHTGFLKYVKRTRMGPLETDIPRAEHPRSGSLPSHVGYWQARRNQDPGLGHRFKYPYGFYGLLELAQDAGLKARCLDECYRIFQPPVCRPAPAGDGRLPEESSGWQRETLFLDWGGLLGL